MAVRARAAIRDPCGSHGSGHLFRRERKGNPGDWPVAGLQPHSLALGAPRGYHRPAGPRHADGPPVTPVPRCSSRQIAGPIVDGQVESSQLVSVHDEGRIQPAGERQHRRAARGGDHAGTLRPLAAPLARALPSAAAISPTRCSTTMLKRANGTVARSNSESIFGDGRRTWDDARGVVRAHHPITATSR